MDRLTLPGPDQDLQGHLTRLLASPDFEPPRLPRIAHKLLALASDGQASFRTIAGLVAQDAFLAGKVFAYANSSWFGGMPPVEKLSHAMVRIGLNGLKQLLLAYSLKGKVYRSSLFAPVMTDMWRHSIASAIASDLLTRAARRPMEIAFVAGLLHDVGLPVALAAVTELQRGQAAGHKLDADGAWMICEALHTKVGDTVARLWKLPPLLRTVIRQHHTPHGDTPEARHLITVIRAADEMCRELAVGFASDGFAEATLGQLATTLGIPSSAIDGLLAETSKRFEAIESMT